MATGACGSVTAVIGYAGHGKAPLLETLHRQTTARMEHIAPFVKQGIAQMINLCAVATKHIDHWYPFDSYVKLRYLKSP